MRKILMEFIACAAVLGFASSAQAAMLFEIDMNPMGTKVFLTAAKDAASSTGTVISPDDVSIAVMGNSDFASGFADISPVKGGMLTSVDFTPNNPNAFNSFSFRGRNILANQMIDVIIQDNQGHAPEMITFTVAKANMDFDRLGIIAAVPGETIKSIDIVNMGGFEQAKQFEFDLAPSAIPEPGTWLVMLAGFGLLGAALRRRGTNLATA